ncbi:glycosyltransferase family 2 protein [Polaromonas sp.]|nr:glycosyltransferase family 2 protein [Candidatus Saccharibacteria bacterium]
MKLSASKPLITVVIPCYNEALNVEALFTASKAAFPSKFRYEIIFIDDGSTDDTAQVIASLPSKRAGISIQCLQLSRNFGKEVAVTAGLHASRGDAVITIDADLQHPPSLIPKLLETWQAGADIAVGVRDASKDYAPLYKRLGSSLFYKILNRISGTPVNPHATDFRLLDRVVVNEFNRFTERSRITRGLIDWLGFKTVFVPFTPSARVSGKTGYGLRKLTGLALTSFVAMSFIPLKLAGYIGLIISLLSGILGLGIIVEMFILGDPWNLDISRIVDLAVLIIFLIGLVLIALGLIALYIATIHTEVTNRPLYVIRQPRRDRTSN